MENRTINDSIASSMRLKRLYPFVKAIFEYDDNGNVKRNINGDPKKSLENDIVETQEYICLDRCLYVDKDTDTFGQIRTVCNKDNQWNPYNDELQKIKLCTKPHVTAKFKRQHEIARKTIKKKMMIYHQRDTFSGQDCNGRYSKPKVEVFQAQIIDIEDDWLILKHV